MTVLTWAGFDSPLYNINNQGWGELISSGVDLGRLVKICKNCDFILYAINSKHHSSLENLIFKQPLHNPFIITIQQEFSTSENAFFSTMGLGLFIFRWGTHLYMPLCSSVRPFARPDQMSVNFTLVCWSPQMSVNFKLAFWSPPMSVRPF